MTHDAKDPADAPPSTPPSMPSDAQGPANAPPSMPSDAQASRWTLLGIGRAVFVASIALGSGAGLGTLITRPPSSEAAGEAPPAPVPAGAAERAILAPLAEGASLGDFEVLDIQAVNAEGAVRLHCVRDRAKVRLDVALVTEDGPEPPAFTDRYAVFYSLKNASPEDGERLARALAEILKKNESAPTPPGMKPFTPKALPPI
ncbi:hypothetical protein [Chondromyces apiculatus]|uniref:Uncharacterized protein n=1 Tax=Chondromyces apiculatus DSM 436 TaxID=1192034 RepID=A0A017TFS4_9BACT|nr:hypothetical protein [Chondromyces apiculatus]EYF08133.1 Hypothetical protein CAP_5893 [Chondromyces apiculatus DSM 436]